jgi:DNA-binding NarL/FixJ family response regulator
MKVFVVEDSAPVCERLIEMIEASWMHQVVGQAATYREAVSGIAATQPDVGIFDIKLKCGSGIEALAEAKRHLPGLVGIVLSNNVTEQHRDASAVAGAAHILDKSADFEQIVGILQGLTNDRAEGGSS